MPRPPRLLLRWALTGLAACVVLAAGLPRSAEAAVTFRGSSCTSGTFSWIPPYTVQIGKPAGTAAGDVLFVTVRGTLTGTIVNLRWPDSFGWTQLHANGETGRTYYRVATAGDPANYTIFDYVSATFPLGNYAASLAAYTGAQPGMELAGPGAVATGTSNTAALPNTTSLAAGSMRHSAVTRGNTSNATYPVPMTENCEDSQGVAVSSGREAVGAGLTTSRNVTYGNSSSWVATTYVVNPVGACSTGGLSMTSPPTVTFPGVVLDGTDQTRASLATFSVNDQRVLKDGWNISATSTTFNNGAGGTFPNTATTVTGGAGAAGVGNCVAPSNSIFPYGFTLPAAAVAPPAVKIFNTAAATGAGPSTVDSSFSLLVPANARTGTYTSTWTFTLAAGP